MDLIARLGGENAVIEGIVEEFCGLCLVPHGSGNEAAESAYLAERLRRMGLSPARDGLYNLYADVPAAPGRENAPLVILQGHMDMVCAVRPGSGYDPVGSPVRIDAADGFLRSDGRSSLGADNNLGNAAVLWLLGRGVEHGPLRLLFTVQEEVGLRGAAALDPAWLRGADYLINTDGFHLGRAVVSSAGGRRETFSRPLETAAPALPAPFRVELSLFTGGHSGDDIHRGRGNPIKLLTAFLTELDFAYELAGLTGGQAHNAIPAQCAAELAVAREDVPALASAVERLAAEIRARHGETDPYARVELVPAPMPSVVWSENCRGSTLELLAGLCCGVLGWHADFPDTVCASANLGRVWARDGEIRAAEFLRCTDPAAERAMAAAHAALAGRTGFAVAASGYPGWVGDAANPLARLMDGVYRRETGRGMEITAVHVGLEPSCFQAKAPGLVMVSTGPDILDAHAVTERAPLASLPPYAALLAGTLEELSRTAR